MNLPDFEQPSRVYGEIPGFQSLRTHLMTCIDRTRLIVASEDDAAFHHRLTSEIERNNRRGILEDVASNTRWIMKHMTGDDFDRFLQDPDERITVYFLAGLTQNLDLYGFPPEAADKLLVFAQSHQNRLVREEMAALLELNGQGKFRLTGPVQRAYARKMSRDGLNETQLQNVRIVEPMKYSADPNKNWYAEDSREFPGKNNYWQKFHGYPLMALAWYGGGNVTIEDFLCIDPNVQVLSQDLQYLTQAGIFEELKEGGLFAQKKTFYRIKDTSLWSGPLW